MNRMDARFRQLAEEGRAAFIPFFTAGDPDADATVRLMVGAEQAGADLIELGFPFSDPIADGPTIQDSYHRTLEAGLHVADVFDIVRRAREGGCAIPVVAMVSYSIVFRMGFTAFVARALAAGIDGATVPDLPVDEAEPLFAQAAEHDFRLICFVTPATVGERRAMVAEHARGFIYYISVRGITGQRTALAGDLADNVRDLKSRTSVPVAVGFGVSSPEQASQVAQVADGVIVGSAIVKQMAAATAQGGDAVQAALDLVRPMAAAVRAR